MKKFIKKITNRGVIIVLLLFIQFVIMAGFMILLQDKYSYLSIFFWIMSLLFVFYIMSKPINPSYKVAWIIPILALPLFGMVTYLVLGRNKFRKKELVKIQNVYKTFNGIFQQNTEVEKALEVEDARAKRISDFIFKSSGFPAYADNDITYFKIGEEYYEALINELKKAKEYIFMEYFIIAPGKMWDSVLEILKDKVIEGVDVRFIYDDFGSLFKVAGDYNYLLESYGIKTILFNRFIPIMNGQLNNRTHRKIVVIDGEVAFTGGINLADEYINEIVRFGHWKDTGIMIKGSAVQNFTLMFLQFWAMQYPCEEDYSKYFRKNQIVNQTNFVQPFSDSPLDNNNVYENVYLQIIYNAKDYVYINTPYLIIDNEFNQALITAARSGIDIRITTPHIPDKKTAFTLTRAFYFDLIQAGVKIYEYTPGFIHAKSFVSDDKISVVGTTNLDFRSFYLNFECGAFIYGEKTALELKDDYLETLKVCETISIKKTRAAFFTKITRAILRLFAPLM